MMLNELALPRFEEIFENCELRQQMSRSNSGLVSLFLRLSVWQYSCSVVVLYLLFYFLHVLGLATMGFGCLIQIKIDSI